MSSFRFFKYDKSDLNVKSKSDIFNSLKSNKKNMLIRGWDVQEGSVKSEIELNLLSFIFLKKETNEVLTIEGVKEFSYLNEIPVILFLEEGIIAISKSSSSSYSKEIRICIDKLIFNNTNTHSPKMIKSNEKLMDKLDEDPTIKIRGFNSKNALGVDKVSSSDRADIKNKRIYEEASLGSFTKKVLFKNYPIGDIKIAIDKHGLIIVFKQLPPKDLAIVLKPLLKYLDMNVDLQKTLSAF